MSSPAGGGCRRPEIAERRCAMRALTLLTVFTSGLVVGVGLTIRSLACLRARMRPAVMQPAVATSPAKAAVGRPAPIHVRATRSPERRHAFAGPVEPPAIEHPIADLEDIPVGPFDPDEALELAEEPTLYEENDLGPHLIEPRFGEEEAALAGLPQPPKTRP